MAAANSDPSVLCWFLYIFVLRSSSPAYFPESFLKLTSVDNIARAVKYKISNKTKRRKSGKINPKVHNSLYYGYL
jgi:hypothetical protein